MPSVHIVKRDRPFDWLANVFMIVQPIDTNIYEMRYRRESHTLVLKTFQSIASTKASLQLTVRYVLLFVYISTFQRACTISSLFDLILISTITIPKLSCYLSISIVILQVVCSCNWWEGPLGSDIYPNVLAMYSHSPLICLRSQMQCWPFPYYFDEWSQACS